MASTILDNVFAPATLNHVADLNSQFARAKADKSDSDAQSLAQFSGLRGQTAVLLGSSITNHCGPYTATSDTTNPSFGTGASGWFIYANAQAGWKLDILKVLGRSGIDSNQLLGITTYTDPVTSVTAAVDYVALALAYRPAFLHLEIGANDVVGTITPDTTLANIQTIISRAAAQGTTVILMTIFPRQDAPATTAKQVKVYAINQGIRQLARSNPVLFWDAWRVLADPSTGSWKTNGTYALLGDLSSDSIHENDYASALLGAELAKLLKQIPGNTTLQSMGNATQTFDVIYDSTLGTNVRGNTILNGGMFGVGGTINGTTPPSGTLPDAWSSGGLVHVLPSGGSIVMGAEARDNSDIYHQGSWLGITIDGGASANYGRTAARSNQDIVSTHGRTLDATTWQPGDTLYAQCRFECLPGSGSTSWAGAAGAVPTFFSLELQTLNVNSENGRSQCFQTGSPGTLTAMRGMAMPSGIYRTPRLVVPVNTTRHFVWFYFNGVGKIRVSDLEIRKVV